MERYDPNLPGTSTLNWGSNSMIIKNGKTAGPQFWDISGTPKARNSANYLIVKTGSNIISDLTLTKSKSPYIVDNDAIVIQAGATLTIEPGVVIKFYSGGMRVEGKIISRGTADEPVVFTSFNDDSYGGDTNNDATSTVPVAGDWFGVEILSTGSSFDNTIFRYGGKWYNGMDNTRANLSIKKFPVAITNSVFEYSMVYGLRLTNSNSNISKSVFSNNEFGLNAQNSSPTIQSNTFRNNRQGLYLSYSPGTVDSNIFESNLVAGLSSAGYLSDFTNNSGSNNGINAIVLSGKLTRKNDNLILSPNPLPYSIRPYETSRVVGSSTLTVKKGTIFKSDAYLNIEGNLIIDGESPSDIIFTSLYDDSIGGDTTNDATSTSPLAGQCSGIRVSSSGFLRARGFTMRYCGYGGYGGNQAAAIIIDGAPIEIRDALLDNNYPYGIYAVNSQNISIKNARFENHNFFPGLGSATALAAFKSFVSLANIDFINNYLGIASDDSSTFTASIVNFINNTFTTSPSGLQFFIFHLK